ncbi:DUF3108 domain-containing protein [Stenotrophomonas sp. MMGLT7]|uniref:DUF3108 domain-containing protein n=1 Tax=Stenotrophomonas sp. MMGLT7 TaxID=2901227 RepID=UPI001E50E1D5|nr:DUF3108 domain-containing protein [Stenotrophomonas sp. MMGLT7]MCD7099366.1 DUF3108 domain-containing protein [Stenotrophomonas sp. MMGLT7]
MKPILLNAALFALALLPIGSGTAQDGPASAVDSGSAWSAPALEPFVATYQALYKGKEAGDATMKVLHNQGSQWRVDMAVHGRKGFAGVLGLNLEQSTVFENRGNRYFPLSQSTVRKGLFLGKRATGVYDWQAHTAQWSGDLKKERRQPIPIQAGDQSALLLNLSLMRDARPGASLHYRYVDFGRVRQHDYRAADVTEIVQVGDLSYDALRVYRTNGGNDETILWIADGVPTPVRILQREDGEDRIDLRLTEYQGA